MRIAMLGFGNVGAAVIDSFSANHTLICAKTRVPITFVGVATRTTSRAAGRVPEGCLISNDCWALVEDPMVDVVLELTGNVPLGRELVLRALSNGKHVVTANKALLALHGEEIMQFAETMGRSVLFEGAVAVSIPIIKTLRESAAANHMSSVTGILNGTSNYVLSQMNDQGVDFATALAEAQRMGYAEADPTLDVSGEDAAHKLTLLTALCFGVSIDFSVVQFKGIEDINRLDLVYAKRLGYRVKLIAHAFRGTHGLSASVEPTLVPATSMLAQVEGSMNGIVLKGDLMGTAFLYGSGAGGRQTASAVLADVIELANGQNVERSGGAYNLGFRLGHRTSETFTSLGQRECAFYLRMRIADKTGAMSMVSKVLADAGVSVSSVLQDAGGNVRTDLVIVTHPIARMHLSSTLPSLRKLVGPPDTGAIYPLLEMT